MNSFAVWPRLPSRTQQRVHCLCLQSFVALQPFSTSSAQKLHSPTSLTGPLLAHVAKLLLGSHTGSRSSIAQGHAQRKEPLFYTVANIITCTLHLNHLLTQDTEEI